MTPDLPIPSEEVEPADSVCRWSNCGLSFECLEDLVTHLTAAHVTSQQGSYFCMWQGCSRDKGFNARYKMLIHIRTHTNERPFVCSHLQCGKRFSRQENLRIHARTHTGEKPYVCSVPGCGKAYSNSSDRFKHSRTHQVDKPYECRHPGCGKRYTDPSSLRKHVKIYSHSSKKLEDSSLSNIPPPSISPSSSGSSSLGTSPVPMAPTPPSLLPASFFSPSHSSTSGCGGAGGYPSPSSAAAVWTMALQQYQINDSFRQYQTELLLRGRAAVSPVDLNFTSSGFMPYSPMSNGIGEEHEEDSRDRGLLTMESPDRTMDGIPERSESPGGMDPDPTALDLSTSPLDLSMPSARRRYQ